MSHGGEYHIWDFCTTKVEQQQFYSRVRAHLSAIHNSLALQQQPFLITIHILHEWKLSIIFPKISEDFGDAVEEPPFHRDHVSSSSTADGNLIFTGK